MLEGNIGRQAAYMLNNVKAILKNKKLKFFNKKLIL